MKKYIPNLDKVIGLHPMLRRTDIYDMSPCTEEEYFTALEKFEIETENKLVRLFESIGITATVKTDRKSLPNTQSIAGISPITSFVNEAYDTTEFFRQVVKKILADDSLIKLRFYIDCEHTPSVDKIYGAGFKYTFNYR